MTIPPASPPIPAPDGAPRPAGAATFAWGGARVGVRSDDAADIAWLAACLRPWYGEAALGGDDLQVDVVHDDDACADLARAREAARPVATPCFALEQEVVTLPAFTIGGEVTVADDFLRSWYRVRPPVVRVVTRRGDRRARFAMLRIVREHTRAHLATSGWVSLHAAAAAWGDRAVLLVGPKQAGKTTLLAYLLATGGAHLVANDWTAVGDDAGGAGTVVRGVPTVVRIRPGSARLLPAMRVDADARSFLHQPGADDPATAAPEPGLAPAGERFERPADFAARLGAAVRAEATLGALVFPEPGARGASSLRRLDVAETAARLAAARYGRGAGAFAPTLFGGGPAPDPTERLRRLAACVPGFALVMAPAAFATDAAARELAAVAGAAP